MSLAASAFRASLALVEGNATLAPVFGPTAAKRRVFRQDAASDQTPHAPFMRVSCQEDEERTSMGPASDKPDHVEAVLTISIFSQKDRAFNATAKGFEHFDDVIKLVVATFHRAQLVDPDGDYEFAPLKRFAGGPGPVSNRDYLHHMERYRIRARRMY